jgi:hypothetical protein
MAGSRLIFVHEARLRDGARVHATKSPWQHPARADRRSFDE